LFHNVRYVFRRVKVPKLLFLLCAMKEVLCLFCETVSKEPIERTQATREGRTQYWPSPGSRFVHIDRTLGVYWMFHGKLRTRRGLLDGTPLNSPQRHWLRLKDERPCVWVADRNARGRRDLPRTCLSDRSHSSKRNNLYWD
jgi:hypothetical protein